MDFQFEERKLKFLQRVLNNRVLFKILLFFQVPINFATGMRLRELNHPRLQGEGFFNMLST